MKWLIGLFLTVIMAVGIAVGLPFEDKRTACWDWPLTNTDGSPLTDLAGAKLYHASVSGAYTDANRVDVGMATPNGAGSACYSLASMPTGKYFFVVTAYNQAGTESAFSNEASKTFTKVPRTVTNLK